MNLTRDAANNITGARFNFVVNLNSFPAGSVWTGAHIHEGAPGIAGPIRVNTGLTPATTVTLTNGTVSNHTFSNIAFNSSVNADAVNLINQMIVEPERLLLQRAHHAERRRSGPRAAGQAIGFRVQGSKN